MVGVYFDGRLFLVEYREFGEWKVFKNSSPGALS